MNKVKKERKRDRFSLVIFVIVCILLVSSILVMIIAEEDSIRSQAGLSLMNCFFMLLCLGVPLFVQKQFRVEIPRMMQVLFVSFCFLGLILGEALDFYDKFERWDSMLHLLSGLLLGALGFILINTLNSQDNIHLKMSPIFVCVAVVCFALAVGVIWELLEYTADDLFGANMQQYLATSAGTLVEDGDVPLVGHAALTDTMKDLLLALIGSTVIAIIGYFQLRHKTKRGFSKMKLEVEDGEEPSEADTAADMEGEMLANWRGLEEEQKKVILDLLKMIPGDSAAER